MDQEFDYPNLTDKSLRELLDEMYRKSKEAKERKQSPSFKGLLEIIQSEVVITKAIHTLKANRGSNTPGSDGETMQENILQQDYPHIIELVRESLKRYCPKPVKRQYIDKPGKTEKRPLGIPTIVDRVIQECVRMVIEPILEAQFFAHSYGFRKYRDASMAIARITNLVHDTGYHWVVEGDISKFFDNVDHSVLIKKLWHMGIKDRRVLMIIKAMLKAGVMHECQSNDIGTPQGGIISPLLANAYLDSFDQWIIREWEEKETRHHYSQQNSRLRALRDDGILKPAFLVRYADDWVLITNSKKNAVKWKDRIDKFLGDKLKLTLSRDKTLITNVCSKPIKFIGVDFKAIKRKSARKGTITRTRPNLERLQPKIKEIHQLIRKIRYGYSSEIEHTIHEVNKINSKIRGIIQYYDMCTWVHVELAKFANRLNYAAYKSLRERGGRWVPANKTANLLSVHTRYTTKIPSIEYREMMIGITNIAFAVFKAPKMKNQDETPFTSKGRELFAKRSSRKPLLDRADELLGLQQSWVIGERVLKGRAFELYNFEYYLNRPFAFNRDRGKCRVCGESLPTFDVQIHHINTKLPIQAINKIPNLASVHTTCHQRIHDGLDWSHLGSKVWNKLVKFREQLN